MDAATIADEARPEASGSPQPGPAVGLSVFWRTTLIALALAAVAAGIVLRFWARSDLWLDEALTVNIARHPLSQLHALLRQDGAPPLYYVLLHFWMKVFGDSNLGVRSLSGVISVLTLPVAWLIGRTYGRKEAWALLVLLASAPFAVYYGTEARMYSLVMLLGALGMLALLRAMQRPRPLNLVGLAVATAAMLYTQYWALYLAAVVVVWLLWPARKGEPDPLRRTNARWCLGAVVVGCLAFVPWLPTFVFQSRHTGTPWANAANLGAVVSAMTGFTDNQASLSGAGSNQGRLLAVLYLVLAFLAVFGLARDRWHIDLDLRTRPSSRGVAFVTFATLLVAVGGGLLTQSAYSNRYASIIFIPFLVLVVLGLRTLGDTRIRAVVIAALVAAGFAVAAQNVTTQRTQATQVAAVLGDRAQPGDVVAYCPDQLGPSVYRLTAGRGYDQITFPRSTGPAIVDWVDYKATVHAASTTGFVHELMARAGPAHSIWLVWAAAYQGYGSECEQIATKLLDAPGYGGRNWVLQNGNTYYEQMNLTQFARVASAGAQPGS